LLRPKPSAKVTRESFYEPYDHWSAGFPYEKAWRIFTS
jgi:hypothetical protein